MRVRGLILSCVTLAAAVVVSASASWQAAAAPSGPITVKVAKLKDGPYVPDRIELKVKHTKDLYLRASTVGDETQTANLMNASGGIGGGDYKVHWYSGRKDITEDVGTSGFDFKLKKGHPRTIRIHVKPLVSDPAAFCIHGTVHVEPGGATDHGQFELNGPSCV